MKKLIRELLLLSIPISILFAVTGMDFIGYYLSVFYNQPYTRSLFNVMLSFVLTAIVLFLLPYLFNKFRWKKPLSYFGTKIGNWRLGLLLLGCSLLFIPLLYINAQSPQMYNRYPLTKDILSWWVLFVLYQLMYVLFYYIPYEFYFRGILQLGLSKSWKSYQSILFVTILTTLLHVTKPMTELVASFFAGIIFGVIAERTDSWIYVFGIHAIIGVMTDIFSALAFVGAL